MIFFFPTRLLSCFIKFSGLTSVASLGYKKKKHDFKHGFDIIMALITNTKRDRSRDLYQ